MRSELVNLSTIKVAISKSFYNGVSEKFYLLDNNGHKLKLKIEKKSEDEKNINYYLKIKNLEIGNDYIILDDHNVKSPLLYTEVVKTKEFDEEFFYNGNDLGPNYQQGKTTFKLWAPTSSAVYIDIEHYGNKYIYPMVKGEKGVFSLTVDKDLELATYTYLVKHGNAFYEAVDPYAYSSVPNSKRSVIVDLHKCDINLNEEKLPQLKNYVDAIIYEIHIRDFSIDSSSKMKQKGKYLAFLEETKDTGFAYLKSLGFTHLQLQPIYDFGSVDELHQFDSYNWGYDPMQYGIPEGSYVVDINNPYARILEFKQMVAKIHEAGLFINMDVVYNHMFSIDESAFDKIVPYYYFRYQADGTLSNGSYCGNDMDSTKKMYQKYMLDMCQRWIKFYGIDGYRFDLMGIHDIETMNKIAKMCKELKPHFMIYGEGWNMPTALPNNIKAIQLNNHLMKDIAHFNDRFRDQIKGSTSDDNLKGKGYCSGKALPAIPDLVKGTIELKDYEYCYQSPNQVINYVECHDNATVWDKLLISNANETVEIRKKRAKLMLSMVLTAQGIPFIHAGEEFYRTKQGVSNSYQSNDDINKLDYDLMFENLETVNYVKDLIRLRKDEKLLCLTTTSEILKCVNTKYLDNGLLFYQIKTAEAEMIILYNAKTSNKSYALENNYDYKIIFDDNGLLAKPKKTPKRLAIPALSMIIIKK